MSLKSRLICVTLLPVEHLLCSHAFSNETAKDVRFFLSFSKCFNNYLLSFNQFASITVFALNEWHYCQYFSRVYLNLHGDFFYFRIAFKTNS